MTAMGIEAGGYREENENSPDALIQEVSESESELTVLDADLRDKFLGGTAVFLVKEEREDDRSNEVFRVQRNPHTYEVYIDSHVTIEDYKRNTLPEDWELMERLAEPLKGKTVVFINPTMAGGGVAMMRPPKVHLARQLGIDEHWYVMDGKLKTIEDDEPKPRNPFIFTKWMHNIIQRRTDRRISEDDEGKNTHLAWSGENADVLVQQDTIINADIIVIDDPQPVPLIPRIKEVNPTAKIIWRNHIDNDANLASDPSTPQGEVMEYLWEAGLNLVDAYVFHPDEHDNFVPHRMRDRAYLAPATIDPYDDMNRELTDEEISEGLAIINHDIEEENQLLEQTGRHEDMQDLIDPERDRFVLMARFDESKGMDKMLELSVLVREEIARKARERGLPDRRPPQIIIIGNGSVDDPSGEMMLDKVRQQRREYPEDVRQDIILKRLKHNYMAINAAMYNKSEEAVLVAAQMSDAEGCETRISDWIRHGIPVVVANRGGMPLQITRDKSGLVLDYDTPDMDFARGAEYVSELMTNHAEYQAVRENTWRASREYNEREYTTVANQIRWQRIMGEVLAGEIPDKRWTISSLHED